MGRLTVRLPGTSSCTVDTPHPWLRKRKAPYPLGLLSATETCVTNYSHLLSAFLQLGLRLKRRVHLHPELIVDCLQLSLVHDPKPMCIRGA